MPWPSRSSPLPFPHVTRLRMPVLLLVGLTLAACGSEPVPEQLAAPAELPSPSASAPPTQDEDALPPVPDPPGSPLDAPPLPSSPAVEGLPDPAEVAEVEQFMREYFEAAARAMDTGDLAELEAFSIPQCNCRSLVEFISRNRPLGVIEGSRTQIRSLTVQSVGAEMASVLVDRVTPDGRVVDANGEIVVAIDNGDGGLAVYALARNDESWTIVQVVEG